MKQKSRLLHVQLPANYSHRNYLTGGLGLLDKHRGPKMTTSTAVCLLIAGDHGGLIAQLSGLQSPPPTPTRECTTARFIIRQPPSNNGRQLPLALLDAEWPAGAGSRVRVGLRVPVLCTGRRSNGQAATAGEQPRLPVVPVGSMDQGARVRVSGIIPHPLAAVMPTRRTPTSEITAGTEAFRDAELLA